MANSGKINLDKLRVVLAFILAVFGLLLSAVLVLILIFKKAWTASDVVAVVGLFTSVLGTIVGAFFGLQIGSAGKDEYKQALEKDRGKLEDALMKLPPGEADALKALWSS